MTWFKVDDSLWGHPKWLALAPNPRARALWVTAGSWAASNLTDGRIPRHVLAVVGGRPRDAAALVDVGLWATTDDGWAFHDWTDFQPTKSRVNAARKTTAERVAKWRSQKPSNAVTDETRNGVTNAAPVPSRPKQSSGLDVNSPRGENPETVDDDQNSAPSSAQLTAWAPPGLPPDIDLTSEITAFRAHNTGRWHEIHNIRRAWLGWLTKATERAKPTPGPAAPRCDRHPEHPAGRCPRCASEAVPPPAGLLKTGGRQ